MKATRNHGGRKTKVPKFSVDTIEDAYTYYVHMMGISEDAFWHLEISSLDTIVENNIAYDGWKASEQREESERRRRESERRRRR